MQIYKKNLLLHHWKIPPIIKALSKCLHIFLPVKIHPNYLASLTLDALTPAICV